jgi:myo-inositol 2-dehydrogenase / D-chiro-inositol 1-dehydrogenase
LGIVRVGVVGAGWIAREHRRVLESAADASLVAVCDTDLDRAGALAVGTGARTYADWRDMLDGESLGALFVCTPPRFHREPAVAALGRGLPVYLEKPVARTLDDALAIVAAAAAAAGSGTACAVGYQWHALDLLDSLPEVLAGQQIGLLTGTSVGPTQSRPWFTDMAAGGGNLLERGSHHLDLIRAVAGEVTAVQAAGSRIRLARSDADDAGDIDDALTLMLSLASGALATVVIAWTRAGQPGSYGLDIVASEATLRLALDPDFALSGVSRGEPVGLRAAGPPFERSVRRFLDAVRDRDPGAVACGPADAAGTLAVAVAAEQALRTARAVPVEALSGGGGNRH